VLAVIRPDSWNLPLFLHVLGAIVLFGSTATVAIVGFASRTRDEHAALLSRVGLWTFLLGIVPGWILMRAGAQWIVDKEFPNGANTPGWVDVGFIRAGGRPPDRPRHPRLGVETARRHGSFGACRAGTGKRVRARARRGLVRDERKARRLAS
jgi:hypothetical protein